MTRPLGLLLVLGLAAGLPAQTAPASSGGKFNAKVKVEPKVVGPLKAGVSKDDQRQTEASVSVGPAELSVGADGAALELGAGIEEPMAEAKFKATLKAKTHRAEKSDFYPEGVPSIEVTGSVGTEASVGVGAAKTSVGTSKQVFKARLDPMQARATNERLKQADKASGTDEFMPEQPKPAPSSIPRSKDANEAIANYNKTQLELAKLTGKEPKLMEPLPVQPGGAPAAPAAPAERTVSGYMVLPRPGDLTDEDWQFFSKTMGEQIAQFNLGGVVQVNSREVRIRFEKMPESSFNQQRPALEQMGYRIQFDP
jgi:hypothetical protein